MFLHLLATLLAYSLLCIMLVAFDDFYWRILWRYYDDDDDERSGVTGVGVWRPFIVLNVCHFYTVSPLFFPEKNWRPFLARHCHFYCFHPGVTPPRRCHPTPFLSVRPRFSTVLCKFSHKKIFLSGVTPWRVSKSKSKAEHLYSALHGIQTTLKRSGMNHTVLPARGCHLGRSPRPVTPLHERRSL